MGLFEKIFKKERQQQAVGQYFQTLTGYTPAFTSFEGSIYEADLTRAAIHAFAKQAAKLTPKITGTKCKSLEPVLQNRPNPFMDGYKFVYRLATMLKVDNNAFIVPIYSQDYDRVVGVYPVLPQSARVIEYQGRPYLRYQLGGGNWAAIEFEDVGILNQYQYGTSRPSQKNLSTLWALSFGATAQPCVRVFLYAHGGNSCGRGRIWKRAAISRSRRPAAL